MLKHCKIHELLTFRHTGFISVTDLMTSLGHLPLKNEDILLPYNRPVSHA